MPARELSKRLTDDLQIGRLSSPGLWVDRLESYKKTKAYPPLLIRWNDYCLHIVSRRTLTIRLATVWRASGMTNNNRVYGDPILI